MKKNKPEIVETKIVSSLGDTEKKINAAVDIAVNDAVEAVKLKIATGIVEPSSSEVKELQKIVFNMKFDYDTLLNYTVSLLTHEQHTLFTKKKKEIFG